MTQTERLDFLIGELARERGENLSPPKEEDGKRRLFRALVNVRPPAPVSPEFLRVQDEFLRGELARRGVTDHRDLAPISPGIVLWKGDVTTLRCGAIVNAANTGLTGCYAPCHSCIDNAVHTFAGVQLRLACAELMEKQGHEEPPGQAKITPGFNLPARYVLHTVGPIVSGPVTGEHRRLLASCYRSCLKLAEENGIKSVAFCCVSTGEFRFPRELAAQIAVETVRAYRKDGMEVIFNVFRDEDERIYRDLLV